MVVLCLEPNPVGLAELIRRLQLAWLSLHWIHIYIYIGMLCVCVCVSKFVVNIYIYTYTHLFIYTQYVCRVGSRIPQGLRPSTGFAGSEVLRAGGLLPFVQVKNAAFVASVVCNESLSMKSPKNWVCRRNLSSRM